MLRRFWSAMTTLATPGAEGTDPETGVVTTPGEENNTDDAVASAGTPRELRQRLLQPGGDRDKVDNDDGLFDHANVDDQQGMSNHQGDSHDDTPMKETHYYVPNQGTTKAKNKSKGVVGSNDSHDDGSENDDDCTGFEPDGLMIMATGRGENGIDHDNDADVDEPHLTPPIYLPCAAYFFFEASISCVMPYLSVYYKELGFSTKTIGVLLSLETFTLISAAPLWGAVADKTRKLSETMLITFVLGVVFRFSIFWAGNNLTYIIIGTVLWSSCHAPVDSLLDSSVIGMLNSHDKAHFGKFRSWSKLGNFVTSAIMGKVVSGPGGYKWAFYTHTVLAIPAIICMYLFRFQPSSLDRRRIRRQDVHLWDGIKLLCTSSRLVFAVLQILTAGVSFGVITAFAYVLVKQRADDDGRSKGWDLVSARTAMAVGAVSMYYVSGGIIRRFGAYPIMVCSLFTLSLAFFCYSLIDFATSPLFLWSGLFMAEFLRGGTFAILWATVMVYIDSISPSGSNSTMMTIMESIFKGSGHTLGSLIGGFASAQVGGLGELFLYMGILQLGVALLSAAVARLLSARS